VVLVGRLFFFLSSPVTFLSFSSSLLNLIGASRRRAPVSLFLGFPGKLHGEDRHFTGRAALPPPGPPWNE